VLINNIFASSRSPALLHGSIVLVELIRKNSSEVYEPSTDVSSLPLVLQILLEHLEKISGYLREVPPQVILIRFYSFVNYLQEFIYLHFLFIF
jgi:hypothetical protein